MTRHQLIEVEWVDSHAESERWVSPDAATDVQLARCRSVGYLIAETEDAIRIAQSIGGDKTAVDEYGQPLTIPKVCLTARREIE